MDENIRTLRTKENRYDILSDDLSQSDICEKKIAIVINLYYKDLLDAEVEYIDAIPKECDVYLISSSDDVITVLSGRYKDSRYIILKKDNRGRDLSALLVCFKHYWANYDYVCFLHDKKTSFVPDYVRPDIDFWVKNLWMNSIGSADYVRNVVSEFEKDEKLGLLVPPEPEGMYTSEWSRPRWYDGDFEQVKNLAKKLDIESDIVISKPTFTLGSVFWCRKEALRKLWEYNWKYEDFPDEPMPSGGTISHAIERIIGYVVQDAGYSVGTVMSTSYASEFFSFLQNNINKMMWCLHEEGVSTEFSYYDRKITEKKTFVNYLDSHPRIYIYGAGTVGRRVSSEITRLGYKVEKFIVTYKLDDEDNVISIEEFKSQPGDGIVVAVGGRYIDEIEKILNEIDIKDYFKYGL